MKKRHRVAFAPNIKPWEQGELDGLCGLYAIVNAIRLRQYRSSRPHSRDATEFFARGVDFLQSTNNLATAVSYGIEIPVWRDMLYNIIRFANIRMETQIEISKPPPSAKSAFDLIDWVHTSLERDATVVMLLTGIYEHYTVIKGCSQTQLLLFDSYGYARIYKKSCDVGDKSTSRHTISRSAMFALA